MHTFNPSGLRGAIPRFFISATQLLSHFQAVSEVLATHLVGGQPGDTVHNDAHRQSAPDNPQKAVESHHETSWVYVRASAYWIHYMYRSCCSPKKLTYEAPLVCFGAAYNRLAYVQPSETSARQVGDVQDLRHGHT